MKCKCDVRLLRRPLSRVNSPPLQPQPRIDLEIRGLAEKGRGSGWRARVAIGAFQFGRVQWRSDGGTVWHAAVHCVRGNRDGPSRRSGRPSKILWALSGLGCNNPPGVSRDGSRLGEAASSLISVINLVRPEANLFYISSLVISQWSSDRLFSAVDPI